MFGTLYEDQVKRQDALSVYACKDKQAVRRKKEKFHVARPNFIKDAERILHCRYFNRYADKTQVFSLYKNDDITRRVLHVQIVSRIARNIGRMLNLNQDLIEAVSLGHDLGHTPFGHAGERFLSALFFEHTGRYFNHNVHSVRILDKLLQLNLSLQTLDGILCHNGEQVRGEYHPYQYKAESAERLFQEFDARAERCYTREGETKTLVPFTLEGCAVRISDVIAYLGKDRQDAAILGIDLEEPFGANEVLGATNAEFISNLIGSIVSESYGKPCLVLRHEVAEALSYEKELNFHKIYKPQDKSGPYPALEVMFGRVYEKLLGNLSAGNESSPIFRHHIGILYKGFPDEREKREQYRSEEPNQIVVDYIASMTDDYFMDLHDHLFPGSNKIKYHSYFSEV
ncbi:MAG TPA: phosphohydrolase [Clostridiales bacterium]|nr:phosphohydrolase [Clostridiales bacterium]